MELFTRSFELVENRIANVEMINLKDMDHIMYGRPKKMIK